MKQYCRYCANCHYGDAVYCDVKNKTMAESTAKTENKCKDFVLNEIDVFDIEKRYKPRELMMKQYDGQIDLFEEGRCL